MGFQNRSSGGGGPLPPRQNVAFQLVSYNLKDRKTPSTDDTFNAIILTDAFGQPAGTELTFKQAKHYDRAATIHSMHFGNSKTRSGPTLEGGQGIAEGAYFDRRLNMVVMNFLKIMVREPTGVDQLLYGQFFGVDRERVNPRSGFRTQNRYMYDVSKAVRLEGTSPEEILAKISEHLATPAAHLGGEPGFVLRGIDLDRFEDGNAFQATRFNLPRIDEGNGAYRNASPEEAIARFAESEYYKEFNRNLFDPNDPVERPLIEIIPQVRLYTGQDSLPTNRESKKDDSDFFKYEVGPINPDPEKKRFKFLIGRGHTHIRWQEPKTDDGTGYFYATYTVPMQRQPEMYDLAELPTPNLPGDVLDFFAARAQANGLKVDPPQSREPRAAVPENEVAPDAPSGPRP